MRELHNEVRHWRRNATFEQVKRRYQWKGMFEDVDEWVKTCEECQRRSKIRFEERLHPMWSTMVWDKVGLHIVYMPRSEEGSYLVLAYEDLSGWVEGRVIDAANSFNVSKFLYEEVVYRHECPKRIVFDGKKENMYLMRSVLENYQIQKTIISAYRL